MATPRLNGRLLPRNDWEGDDFTPGAGGKYVTCVDTAAGRMVAFATNGRVNHDGTVYRKAIVPADPNGITLDQVATAVHRLTGLTLVRPKWTIAQVEAHLRAGRGLVFIGQYAYIPRPYRYQAAADFLHAMFATHLSRSGVRVWDPLNPDIHRWGRWVPWSIIRSYIVSGHLDVAYIGLQPL